MNPIPLDSRTIAALASTRLDLLALRGEPVKHGSRWAVPFCLSFTRATDGAQQTFDLVCVTRTKSHEPRDLWNALGGVYSRATGAQTIKAYTARFRRDALDSADAGESTDAILDRFHAEAKRVTAANRIARRFFTDGEITALSPFL